MPTPSRAVVAFAFLLTTALAQGGDSPRIVHPGRVLDQNGDAVAGAQVTLVTADVAGTGLDTDVVRVTSAENGRFRAELLPTRQYRAWAVAKAGSLAEFVAVSDAVELQLPMTTVRFGEPKQARTEVQLADIDAWREHGEVRVELLVSGAEGFVEPRVMTDTDRLSLPPLPKNDALLELRLFVGGSFVHAMRAYSVGRLKLPELHRVRARCVDEAGEPVAGASIERLVTIWGVDLGPFPNGPYTQRFPVGVTDADGAAEWLVASSRDPFVKGSHEPIPFVASKAGYRDQVAGFTEVVFANGEVLEGADEDRTLPFTMAAAEDVRCVVTGAGASSELQLTGHHSHISGDNTYHGGGEFQRLPLDADGAATRTLPAKSCEGRRLRLTNVVPQLEESDPFRRLAIARPVWLAGERFDGAFTFDVREVVPLRLQIVDQTGGPAIGAYVTCLSIDVQEDDPRAVPMRADAGGRLVAPVLPGRWFVLAIRDGHWCKAELQVEQGHPVVQLKLERMPVMKLRVVDGDGEPLEGATVRSSGASWSSGGGPVATILNDFGSDISGWCMRGLASDANGHVDVPFVATDRLTVDFRVWHGKRQSGELHLREGDERVDVVLQ